MSAVVVWRCVDCAAVSEVIASEPTHMLANYQPDGWSLTIDEYEHLVVRCETCTAAADVAGELVTEGEG